MLVNAKFIPERLRYFREKYDFTQEQLAAVLGVNRSTYAYYETGKTMPGIDRLIKLAEFYHLDIESFLMPMGSHRSSTD